MSTPVVYALKDPRDQRVRYVGVSPEPERRLSQHLSYAKHAQTNNPKDNWLRELQAVGLRPTVEDLETADESNWADREQHWINHYRSIEIDLTNTCRCDGSGRSLPMITEKTCKGPCGQIKPIDEFHWKSKRKGTRQARCKQCMSDYGHSHYVANSQQYKDRANSRLKTLRSENRETVKTHLQTHPCSKCGEANFKVLTTALTSVEINNLSPETLTAKLAETSVLCRNCIAANGGE